jgi:hypothetical protein
MFKHLYILTRYVFHQFHNNIVLLSTLTISITYYIISIYINSQHEFDKAYNNVLYENVVLTRQDSVVNLTQHSKHFQINTLALLHNINERIKSKQYNEAIVHIDKIIEQYNTSMHLCTFLTLRKSILMLYTNETYQSYKDNVDKLILPQEHKNILFEIATLYYDKIKT